MAMLYYVVGAQGMAETANHYSILLAPTCMKKGVQD
jgi:hypothetical protein